MDTPTEHPDWRTALKQQGRTLRWLAAQTGVQPRTVYAYSQGTRVPSRDWIARASVALGVQEAA